MDIRPSPIAGTWYPGQKAGLQQTIDHFLAQANPDLPAGKIWGLLAPHAGFLYSGPVAAYAFQCAAALQIDVVVVVSPYHRAHRAPLLTTGHDAYETPLGVVPVDQTAVQGINEVLKTRLGFGLTPLRNDLEHAVEIELPFLQHLCGSFRLVPVMMRDQRVETAHALGRALADCLAGEHVLIVASSDLSHFYAQDEAEVLDRELLRRVQAFNPSSVINAEQEGVGYACGRGAIAATLWATRQLGANQVQLVRYATSGDVTRDVQSVVGYGSAVIWEEEV